MINGISGIYILVKMAEQQPHVRLTQLASAFKKRSPGEQRAYENLRSTVLDHSS